MKQKRKISKRKKKGIKDLYIKFYKFLTLKLKKIFKKIKNKLKG